MKIYLKTRSPAHKCILAPNFVISQQKHMDMNSGNMSVSKVCEFSCDLAESSSPKRAPLGVRNSENILCSPPAKTVNNATSSVDENDLSSPTSFRTFAHYNSVSNPASGFAPHTPKTPGDYRCGLTFGSPGWSSGYSSSFSSPDCLNSPVECIVPSKKSRPTNRRRLTSSFDEFGLTTPSPKRREIRRITFLSADGTEIDYYSDIESSPSSSFNKHTPKRGRPRADSISDLIQTASASKCPFRCTVCGRVFPRDKSLQAHMRTHTGMSDLLIQTFQIYPPYNVNWYVKFTLTTMVVRLIHAAVRMNATPLALDESKGRRIRESRMRQSR